MFVIQETRESFGVVFPFEMSSTLWSREEHHTGTKPKARWLVFNPIPRDGTLGFRVTVISY